MCGKCEHLVESHIIPRSLSKHMRTDGSWPRVFSANNVDRPKRAPAGIYDPNILCAACEARFSSWDDYAAKIFRAGVEHEVVFKHSASGRPRAYKIEKSCDGRLQMFALSLLYRASISQRSEFEKFNLGIYEDSIRALLIKCDLTSAFTYTTIIVRYLDGALADLILDPIKIKIDQVNFRLVTIPHYGLYVKVDKRPAPNSVRDFGMRLNKPTLALATYFVETGIYRGIKEVLRGQ